MSFLKANDQVYFTGQLNAADVKEAARMGVKAIVCARPDDEDPRDMSFAQVKDLFVKEGGQAAAHIPVSMPALDAAAAAKLGDFLAQNPGPCLMYCKSGMRAATMWLMSRALKGEDPAKLVQEGAALGYDAGVLGKKIALAAKSAK